MLRVGASGAAQHGLEAGGEAFPAFELVAERATACRRESVVAGAAIVVGHAPVAVDQTDLFESLKRRVERALVHLERAFRDLLNALADPPSVHGVEGKRFEDEQ